MLQKEICYWILFVYAISLFWFEAYSSYIYKPMTRFFTQFWRIYNVCMVFLLIASMSLRDFELLVHGDVTDGDKDPIKNLSYQLEVAIFANFTVLALIK